MRMPMQAQAISQCNRHSEARDGPKIAAHLQRVGTHSQGVVLEGVQCCGDVVLCRAGASSLCQHGIAALQGWDGGGQGGQALQLLLEPLQPTMPILPPWAGSVGR